MYKRNKLYLQHNEIYELTQSTNVNQHLLTHISKRTLINCTHRENVPISQYRNMHAHTEKQHRYTTDIKRQLAPIDLSLYLTLPESNYTFSTTQFIV